VLTALEVAGLNLWGTKLVVLSACETGVGDVKRGEGVYGLRRALVLAGSESQVISLWKVSDGGTRDLITNYYQRLQELEGRSEALRQVQLMMMRGKLKPASVSGYRGTSDTSENAIRADYRHPYYWASFIQSGDWRNMLGK
jgi:CHAT domain-containing protein